MDGMALVAMLFKNEQTGYEVWFPDIPMDEPLLQGLLSKYETSGCSVSGDAKDIVEEIIDALN